MLHSPEPSGLSHLCVEGAMRGQREGRGDDVAINTSLGNTE